MFTIVSGFQCPSNSGNTKNISMAKIQKYIFFLVKSNIFNPKIIFCRKMKISSQKFRFWFINCVYYSQKKRQMWHAFMRKVHLAFSVFPFTVKMANLKGRHTVASGSEIKPCIKSHKPLVVYRFWGNVMTSIATLRT